MTNGVETGRFIINLLGSPEIRCDGRVLAFATRKALALLIYLVCEPGSHRREKLATLLWPNASQEHGRVSLRRALAYVREGLGDDQLLQSDGDTLAFNRAAPYQLDLAILQSATLELATAPATSAARRQRIQALQAVATLLRGEFLAEFTLEDAPDFEAWLQTERAQWQRQSCLLLARLSQWQLASGDWQAALASAQQWQRLDVVDEAAYRRQMQAALAGGDRAAALAIYEQCRARLARELGVAPAPETLALAATIDNGRAQTPRPRFVTNATERRQHSLAAPLIGRTEQFATLVAAGERCRRHAPEICLIEGEAGMGKSRLAEGFLAWAEQQGFDLLQGRAFEMGGRVAYQPLVEALQGRLSRENAPDDLLSDLWLSELSRLLPELRDRYPDLPAAASGSEAEAQARLFEAVARLGEALAGRAPLIWWVDDLQWADPASLDLLRFVSRRWRQAGAAILLLFTLRSEARQEPTVSAWVAGCARDLPLHKVTVGALTPAETHQWVLTLAGGPSDHGERSEALATFSQWLHHESEGQPFYLSEILKALVEQGLVQVNPAAGGVTTVDFSGAQAKLAQLTGFVPASVRELIRSRLARLSSAATLLLSAGAVLGKRLDFDQWSQVAGVNESDGLQALDELLAANLLCEAKATGVLGQQPYLFTHDKIRTHVYEETGSARRRVFHRRAFDLLQKAATPAAELSHHALLAGLPAPAFQYALLAGDEALRLFAVQQAITHYQQAHTLLQEPALTAQIAPQQQIHLRLQWGRAYDLQNDWPAARAVYTELLTLARQAHWHAAECIALNRLATLLSWQPQTHAEALDLLEQARHLADQHDDKAGLAETVWNLAQLHMYLDQPEALTYGEEAVTLARQVDAPALLARSLNVLAHAYQNRGRWAEIIPLAAEARQIYAALGDKANEAEQYTLLTMQYCNMGQLAASMRTGRQALALTEAIDNRWGQAFAAFALAITLQDAGQNEEALHLAQQSVAWVAPLAIPPVHIVCLVALGVSQIAANRLPEAEKTLTAALEMNRGNGDMAGNRELLASYQCLIAVQQDRWAAAYQHARQASQSRGDERSLRAGLPRWAEIAALLQGGDVALAQAALQQIKRWAPSSPRLQLVDWQCQIVWARWHGEDIEELRQRALKLAVELGLPHEQYFLKAIASLPTAQ